jgi:hypothetical protein
MFRKSIDVFQAARRWLAQEARRPAMTKDAATTIGMDLGDTWSVLRVLDESGEVVDALAARTLTWEDAARLVDSNQRLRVSQFQPCLPPDIEYGLIARETMSVDDANATLAEWKQGTRSQEGGRMRLPRFEISALAPLRAATHHKGNEGARRC